jgi:hypothetical protein
MSPQQQNKRSPGDFTGRQKEAQAKEQAVAVQDRQLEMSMSNAVETEAERNGVFDAKTGQRIDQPEMAHTAVVVDEQPPPRFGRVEEQVFTGHESPEEVEPILAARRAQVYEAPATEVARSAFVTVRIDNDIDDMTYGMLNGEPNNYTFKEGLQYSIPREVAEHLNDRGLIRQWMG